MPQIIFCSYNVQMLLKSLTHRLSVDTIQASVHRQVSGPHLFTAVNTSQASVWPKISLKRLTGKSDVDAAVRWLYLLHSISNQRFSCTGVNDFFFLLLVQTASNCSNCHSKFWEIILILMGEHGKKTFLRK